MDASFLTFLAISAVVIATPGPDTALGVSAGQLVWALSTSFGLVALLLASEAIFHVRRLVGAAYLVFLGVQFASLTFAWSLGVRVAAAPR